MKKIKHLFLTIIFLLLGNLSQLLSTTMRAKFAKVLSYILINLSKRRREITFQNIKSSIKGIHENQIQSILNESYLNLAIVLLEVLILKKINKENLDNYISYKNPELINELAAKGKGLILLSGHYGNWELLALSAGLISNNDITIIVKQQNNAYADVILNRYRTSGGNHIVDMSKAAKESVAKLKSGKVIALLADQAVFGGSGDTVSFFDKKTDVYSTPSRLALKFGSPIVMGFATRLANGKYEVELTEVNHDDLQNNEVDILELSQRHVKVLEDAIRRNPGLWAWQHRRWKNTESYEKA